MKIKNNKKTNSISLRCRFAALTLSILCSFSVTTMQASAASVSNSISTETSLGDVNGDGAINAHDAATVLVYAAKVATNPELASISDASDTNQDNVTNAVDAALILQYSAVMGSGGTFEWPSAEETVETTKSWSHGDIIHTNFEVPCYCSPCDDCYLNTCDYHSDSNLFEVSSGDDLIVIVANGDWYLVADQKLGTAYFIRSSTACSVIGKITTFIEGEIIRNVGSPIPVYGAPSSDYVTDYIDYGEDFSIISYSVTENCYQISTENATSGWVILDEHATVKPIGYPMG